MKHKAGKLYGIGVGHRKSPRNSGTVNLKWLRFFIDIFREKCSIKN